MFCKIRKGKNGYSVYLCNRKRLDGKVVSKDFIVNELNNKGMKIIK
ncbi:MAG: hypothetical protein SOR73_09670 [Romboutsia timonensis]|nr:hypothetical protein [Romboutsia timonensis]MDY3001919.1 hypothetical protein [Romboutsia timonensis]